MNASRIFGLPREFCVRFLACPLVALASPAAGPAHSLSRPRLRRPHPRQFGPRSGDRHGTVEGCRVHRQRRRRHPPWRRFAPGARGHARSNARSLRGSRGHRGHTHSRPGNQTGFAGHSDRRLFNRHPGTFQRRLLAAYADHVAAAKTDRAIATLLPFAADLQPERHAFARADASGNRGGRRQSRRRRP